MLFHDEIEQKGSTLKFAELPIEAQKSLIRYMGYEGCEWEEVVGENPLETESDWEKAIAKAVKAVGDKTYTLYEMPREVFKELIMQTPSDFAGWHDTFEEYHNWFVDEDLPVYSKENRWPAIAGDPEEGITDGWHRTHSYYKLGHSTLPFII